MTYENLNVGHQRQRWGAAVCAGLAIACALIAPQTRATPPVFAVPSDFGTSTNGTTNSGGFLGDMLRRNALTGDLWGGREVLSKYGLTFYGVETSEVLGNVSGGTHQGFVYEGLTQFDLQADTQRALGWYGGTFNISGLQVHGYNLSAKNLGTLQTASGIEADDSTRLWELWYQQKFLVEDRLDVKIGQQSLDQEYMVSQNALLFVNTMFGWPMLPSADMPGGGPAYPLSAPGIRLRARPVNSLALLAGIYSGSPTVNNTGDPQQQNPSGTSFPVNNGALVMAEAQFSYPPVGGMVYAGGSQIHSGVLKVGFWYDTERFYDQEYDAGNVSLASPLTTGNARRHDGDYAFYGVLDQWVWSDPHDENGDRGLGSFLRVMGTPDEDRNLIDFSMNAGFTFHEPIPHRDFDTAGIGMGFTKVSNHASGLDRDTGFYSGSAYPVRGGETFIEATYQFQVTAWLQVQPDFQYVFNPGAGIPNLRFPGQQVKDEAVLGVRVNILF